MTGQTGIHHPLMTDTNNKNLIKISQIALMLLLILEGSKVINLPSYVARESGRDGWLTYVILLAMDAAVLVALLLTVKKNTLGLPMETILSRSVGKPVTKIILALYFAFFTIRILDLCITASDLFSSTLTLQTNWLGFIVPILFYVFFSARKGVRTIARVSDILGLYVILAAVAMTALSLTQADFSELAPVLIDGISPVIESIPKLCFWFADSIFILFLLKDVKPEKNVIRTPLIAFAVGSLIVVLLYVVFFCIFGNLAQHHNGAIAKIAQFNSAFIFKGRLDWLTLIFWTLSVFIKLALMTYCALYAFDALFGIKPEKSPSLPSMLVFSAIMTVLPVLTPMSAFAKNLMASPFAIVPAMIIEYLIPLLMPSFTKKAGEKEIRFG